MSVSVATVEKRYYADILVLFQCIWFYQARRHFGLMWLPPVRWCALNVHRSWKPRYPWSCIFSAFFFSLGVSCLPQFLFHMTPPMLCFIHSASSCKFNCNSFPVVTAGSANRYTTWLRSASPSCEECTPCEPHLYPQKSGWPTTCVFSQSALYLFTHIATCGKPWIIFDYCAQKWKWIYMLFAVFHLFGWQIRWVYIIVLNKGICMIVALNCWNSKVGLT